MKILTTTISPWESIPIQSDHVMYSTSNINFGACQRTFKVLRRRVTDQLRRDRINNSLETLRLLLLGKTKTHNAWTPRMQKAQILESVVDFLRSDQVMEIISHQQRTGVLSSEGQQRTGVLSSEGQQRTGVLSSEGQQRMGVLSSEGQQGPSRDMMTPDFCGGGMIPQGYCEGMTPQGYVEAMKSESLDNMVPCLPNVRLGRQPGGSWFLVGAGGGGGQQQQGCRQHPAPHGHGIQLHGAVTSPSIGGLSGLTAARLVFNQPRF